MKLFVDLLPAVHLNILVFITFTVLIANTVVFLHFFHEENNIHFSTNEFIVCNALWKEFLSLPSLLQVVSINKIHCRCCRYCPRDRNFCFSATLAAAVAPVVTISEAWVWHKSLPSCFSTKAAIVATGAIIWEPAS